MYTYSAIAQKYLPNEPKRRRFIDIIFPILLNNNVQEAEKYVINLEKHIFNSSIKTAMEYSGDIDWNSSNFKRLYYSKCRQLRANVDPDDGCKNPVLILRISANEISPEMLANMTYVEMWPKKYVEIFKEFTDKLKKIPLEDRPDGLFKCGKCKSYKTEFSEKQLRSADEPTTKFCYCWKCGNRWKFC